MTAAWSVGDIPHQRGKRAVVTGATGGLGFETALELARREARVILAGRNPEKGKVALSRILQQVPQAQVTFELVDLASLACIEEFARRLLEADQPIDLLINNAGVMALPRRKVTADDFELQFGTNYLSHFLLTARLLPLLRKSSHSRVIQLSSLAHRRGAIHFDDLQQVRYDPWRAYCQSKLAMLIFAFELQRRSDEAGWNLLSLAAHPGWARTDLVDNGPASESGRGCLWALTRLVTPLVTQSAAAGALPTLYAACHPQVQPGGYYGPHGWHEIKGYPCPSWVAPQARDRQTWRRLWEVSEELCGHPWPGQVSSGSTD